MRQNVVRYECDSCHKVVEDKQGTFIIRVPKEWLHIEGYTNSHSAFKLDLCEDCKQAIMQFTENT